MKKIIDAKGTLQETMKHEYLETFMEGKLLKKAYLNT